MLGPFVRRWRARRSFSSAVIKLNPVVEEYCQAHSSPSLDACLLELHRETKVQHPCVSTTAALALLFGLY